MATRLVWHCAMSPRSMTWEEIGKNAGMPQSEIDGLAELERTTVTKKIRRVFSQSWELLKTSAEFCGATKIILNLPSALSCVSLCE